METASEKVSLRTPVKPFKATGKFDFETGVSFEKKEPSFESYCQKVTHLKGVQKFKNSHISTILTYLNKGYEGVGVDSRQLEREYRRKNNL